MPKSSTSRNMDSFQGPGQGSNLESKSKNGNEELLQSNSMNCMDRLVSNRYRIEKKIGAGAFGTIYSGVDVISDIKVAIKTEPKTVKVRQLEYESKVYKQLQGSPYIPTVHVFIEESGQNVLVMELLGSSLEDLFTRCNRKFSLRTVLMLADQMIQRIECLHSKHFIHRDIKPDNFVMGIGENSDKVYLIDFGLVKPYRRPGSLTHIPFKEGKNLTGTARYASLNAHRGYEQSRRDDMESLGYVLVYFLSGGLPWQGLRAHNKNDKYGRIFEKKTQTTPEDLCSSLAPEFVSYFHHVRSLRFDERPDYEFVRKLFKNVMKRERFKCDNVFDWTPPLYSGQVSKLSVIQNVQKPQTSIEILKREKSHVDVPYVPNSGISGTIVPSYKPKFSIQTQFKSTQSGEDQSMNVNFGSMLGSPNYALRGSPLSLDSRPFVQVTSSSPRIVSPPQPTPARNATRKP